jgi:hypothetical protein
MGNEMRIRVRLGLLATAIVLGISIIASSRPAAASSASSPTPQPDKSLDAVVVADHGMAVKCAPGPLACSQRWTSGAPVNLLFIAAKPGNMTKAPTGTVTFRADGKPIGAVPINSWVATFSTTDLQAGSHVVEAVYSGDATYPPLTTRVLALALRQSPATATVPVAPAPAPAAATAPSASAELLATASPAVPVAPALDAAPLTPEMQPAGASRPQAPLALEIAAVIALFLVSATMARCATSPRRSRG